MLYFSLFSKCFTIKLSMKVQSPVFNHNEKIPAKYTCDGENINPPLLISDASENAQGLVLVVDDPDAPAGTFVHWTIWNINPKTAEIPENTVPIGAVEGTTSYNKPGFGGPCPPAGSHRYFFKLYALNSVLDLPASASKEDLEKAMEGHILEQAELIGFYERFKNG